MYWVQSPKIWVDCYFSRCPRRRADMQPISARLPEWNQVYEGELNADPRLGVYAITNVDSLDVANVSQYLRILRSYSPSSSTAILWRRFSNNCNKSGYWTRYKEKMFCGFLQFLLSDGEPVNADMYRIRQLAVALETAEGITVASSLIIMLFLHPIFQRDRVRAPLWYTRYFHHDV